jgi:hypothetical protein
LSLAPTYHRWRDRDSSNLRIGEHSTISRRTLVVTPVTSWCQIFYSFRGLGKPLAKVFCTTEGFHSIPFLRDRIYLDELAAADRAEAHRIDSISPLQSWVGKHYTDYYFPDYMSIPGSPIPVDDETVDINTEDVEYAQTDAQPPASNTSALAKRPLELTDIEGSFKRGVTSALQQRPLFILDKDTITAADATAFQIQANRWNDNFALSDVIVGRAVDLLDICIRTDTSFTMLSDTDVPRWLELLTVAQAPSSSSDISALALTAALPSPKTSGTFGSRSASLTPQSSARQ